ncbi:MAG: PAS/PAC sensor signal transduction histidine kinase, partial [Promethearchaeota archaeon CR_4]
MIFPIFYAKSDYYRVPNNLPYIAENTASKTFRDVLLNYYALISLAFATISFYVGVVVYQRKPYDKLHRIFFVDAFFIAMSLFVEFLYRSAESMEVAFIWTKIGSFSPMPVALLLHFAIEYASPPLQRQRRILLLVLGYVTTFVFICLYFFTNLMWEELVLMDWGWTQAYKSEGLPTILVFIWVAFMVYTTLYLFGCTYKNSKNSHQKQQAKYLFFASLIPFIGGTVLNYILPLFTRFIPPLFNFSYIMSMIIIAYAILRYDLFMLRTTEIAEHLLSKMSEAVLLVDPSENVENLNQAFVNLTGFGKQQILGQSIAGLFQRETTNDKGQETAEIISILKPTVIQNLELNLRTNSGSTRPVIISKSPLEDRKGRLQGFLYLITDVASRQQAENNMQVHKTLEIADDLNADLLNWASHEIKTPLVPILGLSELFYNAKKEGKDLNTIFNEADFQALWRSATRLEDIVKNFLDAGLIQKHGLKLTPVSTDISGLLKESLDVMERYASEKRIRVNLPTISIRAEVDESKLRQCLINLLSNAIKYSPPNSEVAVMLDRKTANQIPGFEIQIIDHGYGFTPQELNHVFEPFMRVHTQQEEKKYVPGVGLGLYICKYILSLHGGQITLNSEGQGKGTTILVW